MFQQGHRFLIPKTGNLLIVVGGSISAMPTSQARKIIASSADEAMWAQTKWKFITMPIGTVFLCIDYELVDKKPSYAKVTVLWEEELYDLYAGIHTLQVLDNTNIWLSGI